MAPAEIFLVLRSPYVGNTPKLDLKVRAVFVLVFSDVNFDERDLDLVDLIGA